jgi:Yip1 domain
MKRRVVRSELAVVWDVIVAPRSAFATIRERPRWLIAYLVSCVLFLVGAVLKMPASVRIEQNTFENAIVNHPNWALPPDEQQAMIARVVAHNHQFEAALPVFIILGVAQLALILWIVLAFVKGHTRYSEMFALVMNVWIVNVGLSGLYFGIAVALITGTGYQLPQHPNDVVPSVALLAPNAGPKLRAFLSSFDVFELWSIALLALGFQIIGRVSRATAIWTAIVPLVIGAATRAYFAR